MNYKRKT